MSGASIWEQFSHDPRRPEHGRLRASDRDRDVISDVLGTAYAEGRLTPAELDERSDAVAQARTLSELPAIIDDLVAPSLPAAHLVPSSPAHREVAERRYRRLRLATQIVFLVPTLICWVVWLSVLLGGVGTPFPWPIFPTLGTSIPLVIVVASRKEIIAGSEARLARREQRAMQRFQSRTAPRPLGPPSGPPSGSARAREAVTPPVIGSSVDRPGPDPAREASMDVRELVATHYGAGDLSAAILEALATAGVNVENLGADDLFPVDQLHAGGIASSRYAVERLGIGPGTRLLDVGCGIGGPSRLAATYDAQVTGVDLTPEFVEAATTLTERVGLSETATFVATPGETLPFGDGSFDAALMVHVGMNVPDKLALFTEVHRVLEPGGRFAVFDQMRTGEGALPYPMPWAEDRRSSFVETVSEYTAHLATAGFTVMEVEDRTESTLGPPPDGPLSPMTIFGAPFRARIGNNVSATRAGRLGAVLMIARA